MRKNDFTSITINQTPIAIDHLNSRPKHIVINLIIPHVSKQLSPNKKLYINTVINNDLRKSIYSYLLSFFCRDFIIKFLKSSYPLKLTYCPLITSKQSDLCANSYSLADTTTYKVYPFFS